MRLSIIGLCAALVCSQIGLQAYALRKHYEETLVDAELREIAEYAPLASTLRKVAHKASADYFVLVGAAFALFSAFAAGAGLASVRGKERARADLAAALKDKESLLADLSDLSDLNVLRGRDAELRAEAQHLQSCKMSEYAAAAQKANRAKSAFLAAMSHEIRTPLTAVIGYTSLLAETPLSEEQKAHVKVLRTSSHHLLALVGDILDFSKLESGNLALDCEALDLDEIMREVESITHGLLGDRPVRLRVHVSPDAPRWIMGDAARMKQVLLNFTSNAVKFTNAGEIALEVAAEGTDLVFSVRDTGIGVPVEDQERIFSAFEQVRGDGPIYRAGAGLGLSISKSLAEAMAGSIGVKSEAGQGSCFWFRMPRVDAPTPLLVRSQIAQAARTPVMRILVAEDAPSSARLIEAILTRMNHIVVLAGDGAQALEAARGSQFDLVLMDLQMPVKGGLEAARDIRALGGEWRTIPIFALTAAALQEDQDAAQEAGMDEFLTKPFTPEDLAAALSRAALRNLDAQRTTTHRIKATAAPSADKAQASTDASARLRRPAGGA